MRFAFACLAFAALAGPAAAQQADATPGVLDQVYACADVAPEAERLACYDAAVGRLRAAHAGGDLVAVDRALANEVEREGFGFTLPSLPRIFARSSGDGEDNLLAESDMEIAQAARRGDGLYVFSMTNGQVWRQIENERMRLIRPGATVTIRRAAMGTFLMAFHAGGPSIRVRRLE